MKKRPKNILDKIGTLIPGFDGYATRDNQRKSDKLLRTNIADTLKKVLGNIEQLMKVSIKKGLSDDLMEFEESRKACSTIAERINYAEYGASALFDEEQIKEDELDEIYRMDEILLEKSNYLYLIVQQDHESSFLMAAIRNQLKEIDSLFIERSNYIRLKVKK
jgi:hypothetical protein